MQLGWHRLRAAQRIQQLCTRKIDIGPVGDDAVFVTAHHEQACCLVRIGPQDILHGGGHRRGAVGDRSGRRRQVQTGRRVPQMRRMYMDDGADGWNRAIHLAVAHGLRGRARRAAGPQPVCHDVEILDPGQQLGRQLRLTAGLGTRNHEPDTGTHADIPVGISIVTTRVSTDQAGPATHAEPAKEPAQVGPGGQWRRLIVELVLDDAFGLFHAGILPECFKLVDCTVCRIRCNRMELNSTEEIIEDLRQGRMVIIMDDEDRENEGDLVMAAEKVTPAAINFMAHYGRGLICLTLTKERCRQLRLPLMVNTDNQLEATNFTVSIEAAEGVTTGISAADRATTMLAAVKPDAQPQDLVQPGHIFPLMAQPGGVLVRAGHTEAGCDLARLAGFRPTSVIVEILNEDGSMARRPDLEMFAAAHDLKIGTIADLIQYRIQNEKTVERVSYCTLPTQHGDFQLVAYQDVIGNEMHLALVKGEINPERPTLVRVHVQNTLCDMFESTRDCGWPLRAVMDQVSDEGEGVIVVLRNYDTARDIVQRIQDYKWHGVDDPIPERSRPRTRTCVRLVSAPRYCAISGYARCA